MPLARRLYTFLGVCAVSIGFDQLTKLVATDALKGQPSRAYLGNTVRLVWAQNDGAFLSLGANLPEHLRFVLLTIGVGLLLIGLTGFALFSKGLDGFQVTSYALIASGGLSNWVDRARFGGKVVDFMQLGIGTTPLTGVFNVADLAIVVGIALLVVEGYRADKRKKAASAS